MLKRHGNGCFHVILTWSTRGTFVGFAPQVDTCFFLKSKPILVPVEIIDSRLDRNVETFSKYLFYPKLHFPKLHSH